MKDKAYLKVIVKLKFDQDSCSNYSHKIQGIEQLWNDTMEFKHQNQTVEITGQVKIYFQEINYKVGKDRKGLKID